MGARELMCAVIESAVNDYKHDVVGIPVVDTKNMNNAEKKKWKAKVIEIQKTIFDKDSGRLFLESPVLDNIIETFNIDVNVSQIRKVLKLKRRG